jgi:hypothetical protein
MGGLWYGGAGGLGNMSSSASSAQSSRAESMAIQGKQEVNALEHQIERLSLLNQALWEILRDRLKMTDADLERVAQEIDLRDGREDGKITGTAMKCPSCGRVSNSKHYRCMYCSLEFEKPLFG